MIPDLDNISTIFLRPPRCEFPDRILDAAYWASLNPPTRASNIALEPGDMTRYEFTIVATFGERYDSATRKTRDRSFGPSKEQLLVLHTCGKGTLRWDSQFLIPHEIIELDGGIIQSLVIETGDGEEERNVYQYSPRSLEQLERVGMLSPNQQTAHILGMFILAYNVFRLPSSERNRVQFLPNVITST